VPTQWHLFAVQTSPPKDATEEPPGIPPELEPMRRRLPRRWIVTAVVALATGAAVAVLLTRGGGTTAAHLRSPGSTRVAAPDNAALQIAPASGKVRTTVTGVMAGNAMYPARHIEVGEGGVWVDTAITLQHIDPRTGTLVGQIQAQPLVSTIAVGQGAVWAAGNIGISRISPATDKVEATIRYDTGQAKPIRIAVAGGAVWMLVTDGRLIRVDAGTNRITRRLQIGTAGADLAVTPSALWVLDPVGERVYEVDPKTAEIVRRVSVAGNLERVVVGAGEIWVLDENAGVVTPIDPTTGGRGAPIRVGAGPVDMTFGLGAVWVANRGGGTITRIEPQLLETRTIQVGGSIAAIAVDPDTRTLWVYLTQRGDP
jgi:DNA-binding beta-propeller fold protein YncE